MSATCPKCNKCFGSIESLNQHQFATMHFQKSIKRQLKYETNQNQRLKETNKELRENIKGLRLIVETYRYFPDSIRKTIFGFLK